MKDQYLGDNRDLFKFDLAETLVKRMSYRQLLYIPMLTPDEGNGDGRIRDRARAKAGTGNKRLTLFLDTCGNRQKRCVRDLDKYFDGSRIGLKIHGHRDHGDEAFFVHEKRADHFQQVFSDFVSPGLILLDPDNGLQIKRSDQRHLMYDEIRLFSEEMPKESAMMIYQHFPRRERSSYLKERSEKLAENLEGCQPPLWIHDKQIALFLISWSKSLNVEMKRLIRSYRRLYSALESIS